MAPTNRLIEARRAELRAETKAQKPGDTKAATARAGAKRGAAVEAKPADPEQASAHNRQ